MRNAVAKEQASLGAVRTTDARADPRTDVNVPAAIGVGRAVCEGLIVDVAAAGARVRLPVERTIQFCLGQQIIVTPAGGAPMPAILRWSDREFVGIRFLTPISADTILQMVASSSRHYQPRPTRIRVGRPAMVTIDRLNSVVHLANVSSGGALIRSIQKIAPGTPLFLHFDGSRPIGGYARWATGANIGVMFSRLLPLHIAARIAELCDVDQSWIAEVKRHHLLIGNGEA